VLLLLYHEKAYKKFSPLPKASPRFEQSSKVVLERVFLAQTGVAENIRGSNFKKCWDEHVSDV
jgi:hypothetical protein